MSEEGPSSTINKNDSSYNNNLRRVFHFTSITAISLVYGLCTYPWDVVMPVLSIISMTFIGLEVVRLQVGWLNDFVQKYLKFIMRKHEIHTISGTSWFLLGAMISLSLFLKPVSVFGFLVLAVGDPLASYIGIASTQGQKLGQKTWAGCWGFFLVSWLVGFLWLLHTYSPLLALTGAAIGSFGAAVTERALTDLDDNIAVPLVASGLATAWFNLCARYAILS